nr:chloroplast protein import component Tic20-II [Passiflora auriculata]
MASSISLLRFSTITAPKSLAIAKPYHFSSYIPPPTPFFLKSPPKICVSQKPTLIRMSYNPIPATDRLISAVSYTLPFFNSIQYGRFLFVTYPPLALLFDPLIPLLNLYRSIPYASFAAFFALCVGVGRNPSFNQYVRFNAMQAVTLDLLLLLSTLLVESFQPRRSGPGFKIYAWLHSAVFLFNSFCFGYALVNSILGRTPYLPFVSSVASKQL